MAHAEQIAREKAERGITVRELAHEWSSGSARVKQIKPATLVDYHALLREPGVTYARGSRVTHGRMMKALGPPGPQRAQREQASPGSGDDVPPRLPRRHLQPAEEPGRPDRQAPGAAAGGAGLLRGRGGRALARAAAAGLHRTRERDEPAIREDLQDAELYRVLFYTGLRVGEAVVLRWDDVDPTAASSGRANASWSTLS